MLRRMDWIEAGKQIESRDSAMDMLRQIADAVIKAPAGPVQVGVAPRILTPKPSTSLLPITIPRSKTVFAASPILHQRKMDAEKELHNPTRGRSRHDSRDSGLIASMGTWDESVAIG